MSTTQPAIPAVIASNRAIGAFVATVTIEEIATDDVEITQHPVQQGASIADHAYVKPATVTIKFMMGRDDAPLEETYAKLLALQASREPFDVVTGKRQYKNMLFKSLAQTTDRQTEHVLAVTAQLQEVRIVAVEVTSVPPRHKQKLPGKTGPTQNAGTKKPEPKRKSAIRALAGP